jgi:phage terminase large subunit
VDAIGIGAGVVDQLLEVEDISHIQIVGVNSSVRLDDGQNYNLRARMWRDMKDWLDPLNGPVSLANDRDLEVDLTALQYLYKNGLLLIESKDDAKKRGIKSPDRADALALTFAEPVKPRKRESTAVAAPAVALDPYAGY